MEKEDRDFTGFLPSKDLFNNLAQLKLIPHTVPLGKQWHRGLCPMAFASKDLAKLKTQRTARTFGEQWGDKILWTAADQKCFDLAPPHIPASSDSVLLMLQHYTKLLCRVFGDLCTLKLHISTLELALAEKRFQIMNSLSFMSDRMPSILWELTLCAASFFTDTISAEDFDQADQDQQDPPYATVTLNVELLASLTTVPLSDLPPFLSALQQVQTAPTANLPLQPHGGRQNASKPKPYKTQGAHQQNTSATRQLNQAYHLTLRALWNSLPADPFKRSLK